MGDAQLTLKAKLKATLKASVQTLRVIAKQFLGRTILKDKRNVRGGDGIYNRT
jgi:hypothetical protein